MNILAIDPGPTHSAFVLWQPGADQPLQDFGHCPNKDMLAVAELSPESIFAIEMVASYGMAVGKDVFETVFWIGRFWEASWSKDKRKVYRKDVKMHLCHSMRAKDGNIRQSLLDKHGPVGTKKAPGPLYGVSKHVWAALAVADYVATATQNNQ